MCAIYVDLRDIYVDLCDICEFQYIIIFVMQNKKNRPKFYLFQLCHLPRKAVGKEPFATCQERQSAKGSLPPVKKCSRQRAPSSHNGVCSLCRLPYWQVAKALPTAFLLASGKGFFADEFFAGCSLPTATCNAVGKVFATCFRAFVDCFWQSARTESQ